MKLLIDTNVVLDALAEREPFANAAKEIIRLGAAEALTLYMTATSVTDIYYLLHKHYHDKETCNAIIMKLFVVFSIADVTGGDCKRALNSQINDYEDAVFAESAKRNKMAYIVTRNSKDFRESEVKAVTPEELLKNSKLNKENR